MRREEGTETEVERRGVKREYSEGNREKERARYDKHSLNRDISFSLSSSVYPYAAYFGKISFTILSWHTFRWLKFDWGINASE